MIPSVNSETPSIAAPDSRDTQVPAARYLRFRRVLFGVAGAYLFFCVFLGGYPLRSYLPSFLVSGKTALLFAAICLLLARGAFQSVTRALVLEGVVLLGILAVAAYLRFHGIAAAAENGPTMDEPIIVAPVLNMLRTGILDPRAYEYGSVWFYMLLVVFVLFIARTLSSFAVKDAAAIPEQGYYTAGRYAAAFLSWATVVITYFTARRFFGKFPAIVAASVLAVSSVSYLTARQIRLDVPLAFFVLIAHYFFLRLQEERTSMNSLWAGVFSGLAVGTKYTVLPIMASLLLAHLLTTREKRVTWNLLLSVTAAAGVFLITNFYAFAHLNEFIDRLPRAMVHNLSPRHWSATDNRPLLYFRELAGGGIGVIALVPALFTLSMVRDNRILVMWSFPLIYIALIGSFPSGFPRYLLPVLPLLAILSGIGTQRLLSGIKAGFIERHRHVALALSVLLLVALPLYAAIDQLLESRKILRPKEVVSWIQLNVPAGSAIIADPTGPLLPADRYRVRTPPYRDFQDPEVFRKADYVCVTEDLFRRIPAEFQVLHEFPARTRDLDRSIRIYIRK